MVGKCHRNCWTKGAGQPMGEAGARATVYGMRLRSVHVTVSGCPTRLMALHSRRLEGIKVQGESLPLGKDARQADSPGPGASPQRRGVSLSTQRHRCREARVWSERVLRGKSPRPPEDGVECEWMLGQRRHVVHRGPSVTTPAPPTPSTCAICLASRTPWEVPPNSSRMRDVASPWTAGTNTGTC
jgi:hypothetical protein